MNWRSISGPNYCHWACFILLLNVNTPYHENLPKLLGYYLKLNLKCISCYNSLFVFLLFYSACIDYLFVSQLL